MIELRNTLLNLYSELGSWQRVADAYGVSKATVWRIAKDGYTPKKLSVKKKLGLADTRKRRRLDFGQVDDQTWEAIKAIPKDELIRRLTDE